MLGLIIDAAVIIGLIQLVNQGQQTDFWNAVIVALLIGLGSWGCVVLLGGMLGAFSLLPMVVVATVVIWMLSGIPLDRAAIAGVLFVVYRIALYFVLALLL